MLVPTFFVFLILRLQGVDADFHFLSCRTVKSSMSIPANPAIAVPASDMSSCSGILGSRMVIVETLTQEIGQQSVFGFDGFCDTQQLNVYTRSSELLEFYYNGGVGGSGLQGTCAPTYVSETPQNLSCVSADLSLNCTDSWTCFSGVCETVRNDSTTTPFLKPPTTTDSTNSLISTRSGSIDAPLRSTTTGSTAGSMDAPLSSVDSAATSRSNRKKTTTTTVLASIFGVLCFGFGLAIVFLVFRSRIRMARSGWGRGGDGEQTTRMPARTHLVPFRAMQSSLSAVPPKTAGASAPRVLGLPPDQGRASSWQTQPPAYVPQYTAGYRLCVHGQRPQR
ncbi:hypothetical protein C8F01DRAFT_544397 [Mycena amicta]|nr:hypothetical protein C8F01DRAFT_544397 [Mycena amicta]